MRTNRALFLTMAMVITVAMVGCGGTGTGDSRCAEIKAKIEGCTGTLVPVNETCGTAALMAYDQIMGLSCQELSSDRTKSDWKWNAPGNDCEHWCLRRGATIFNWSITCGAREDLPYQTQVQCCWESHRYREIRRGWCDHKVGHNNPGWGGHCDPRWDPHCGGGGYGGCDPRWDPHCHNGGNHCQNSYDPFCNGNWPWYGTNDTAKNPPPSGFSPEEQLCTPQNPACAKDHFCSPIGGDQYRCMKGCSQENLTCPKDRFCKPINGSQRRCTWW